MSNAFMRWIALGLILLAAPCAHAEDKQAARSQEQLRRLRQQVQQLQQAQQTQQQNEQKIVHEKGAADELLKRRSGELGSARQKLTATERQLSDVETRLKSIEQERDALTGKLGDTSKKLAELELLQRDTAGSLRTRDGEVQSLKSSVAGELAERKRCEANNIALYQYGRELMTLYENKGVVSSIWQREPLLGLGQVKTENMLEEYRDKLDAQKRLAAQMDSKAEAASKP